MKDYLNPRAKQKGLLDEHTINDRFMNPAHIPHTIIPFRIDGDREPRADISKWRIQRSNARSIGKPTYTHDKPCKCGSVERRVYDNKCSPCFKLENK